MGRNYTQKQLDVLKRYFDDFFHAIPPSELARHILKTHNNLFKGKTIGGIMSVFYRFYSASGNLPWERTTSHRTVFKYKSADELRKIPKR